ncbi:MAG TPA: hypothetical protein VNH18_29770 [Bryobacteraceae bacterium]|nr:hypothetical protein [Bryobacteraceae bacterium]
MRLEAAIRDLKRYLRNVDRSIATFEAAAERELAEKCTPQEATSIIYRPSLIWDNGQQTTRPGQMHPAKPKPVPEALAHLGRAS